MKYTGRKFLYLLMLSVMVSLAPASAQEKMTIEQAIDIGIKNSKTLNISSQKVLASKAKTKELRTSLLPALKLSASYTRLSEVDPFAISMGATTLNITSSILNNYSAKLSLVQPLFMGNKITAGIDAADYSLDASNEDYSKDREDLVLNIKSSYWTLYKAVEMKKVLDENVAQIQAHVADAKNMMAQGMMTRNDVLKIEVQLSDIKYKQADANNAVQLSSIALNNVLGIPLTTNVTVGSGIEVKEFNNNDLANLLSTSYSVRPELRAADLRSKAGEAGVTAAQSGWYPQLNLVGNYTYARPNSRIFPTKDQFDGTWDVSLALSYDLWNWNATSYQTQQAEAQLLQAKDAYSLAKDAVTLEVTQNFLNVNQAKEKIAIAKLAQEQAEENFRVTGEKFKQGLALSSELIDAEVAYLQAKTNYTTSVVDYELALARLQKSVGNKSL